MLRRLLPVALVVAVMGCQNMSNADLATRVISGGIVAAQGLFISEADEIRIGQETTAKVLSQMPEFPNPDIRDYVNEVGQKLVAQSDRKNLTYQFRVIHASEINAFAAPGGFLFVTTGALRLMKNEAQLAGVLGHEVAHVAKRHSIEGIKQAMIAQGVATAVLGNDSNKLVETAANVAANLILKGFGRGAELESDRLGAAYAYGAGYDPRALGQFLDALRKTSGDVPVWLAIASDHPRTDDRLAQLDDYIVGQQMKLDSLKTGEAIYKTMVLDRLGSIPDPAPRATPSPSTASPAPNATPTPYHDPAN